MAGDAGTPEKNGREDEAMKGLFHVLRVALVATLGFGAGGCASASNEYSGASYPSQRYDDDYDNGYDDYDDGYGGYYNSLDRYGTWVESSAYGQVWCPLDVSVGWRPYTVGSWAYTDYGWMWVAEDPWGYIPYQYGRWTFDSYYGWVWIPGDVWGPAWVSWRYGDGWIGWAPLPPDVGWQIGIGLSVNSYALDSRIDSYQWCFVPARDILSSSLQTRIVAPSRNVTFISVTENVTNYTVVNSRPAERGLRPEMIERDTGRRITPYRVVESGTPRGSRGAVIRGQTIEVYRPAEKAGTGANARERARTQPRERMAPPRQLIQRQETERRQFDQKMQSERAQLDREHQRELRQPPRGVSREQLAQRQRAEMQAQQEREARERKALEERTKRLKERADEEDRQKQQPPGQNRNQDRGRGRGRGNN